MRPHDVILDESSITARTSTMAAEIVKDLAGRQPIIIGLLTGGLFFLVDLARALTRLGIDPEIDFLETSAYEAVGRPAKSIAVGRDISRDIRNQAVLIVDDVFDSGRSLEFAAARLRKMGPAWLRTCVLVRKDAPRTTAAQPDYVGFDLPNLWLVGCGMDADHELRALPYVGALKSSKDQT